MSETDPVESFQTVLAGHVEACIADMRARGYALNTRKGYATDLRSFLHWLQGQGITSLSDISPLKLQDYMIHLSLRASQKNRRGAKKKLLSPSARNGHISALRKLFSYLTERGLLLRDPSLSLKRVKEPRRLPRNLLTPSEMLRVLAQIKGTDRVALRDRAVFELMYSTGIRRIELERLDLNSLRLGERVLEIDGKGDKFRLVPVGKEAYRALIEYLELGRPQFQSRGSEALFLSTVGGRIHTANLLTNFRLYVSQAGIKKKVDLHSIRHMCATHMLQGKADVRYVQELLGHVNLSTTQLYTKVDTTDLKKVLDQCHPRDKF